VSNPQKRPTDSLGWIRWARSVEGLSPLAGHVFLFLASHVDAEGRAKPSVERITRKTGRSARRVHEALAELRAAEVVTSKRRGPFGGNRYRLVWRALTDDEMRGPSRNAARSGSVPDARPDAEHDARSAAQDDVRPAARKEETKRRNRAKVKKNLQKKSAGGIKVKLSQSARAERTRGTRTNETKSHANSREGARRVARPAAHRIHVHDATSADDWREVNALVATHGRDVAAPILERFGLRGARQHFARREGGPDSGDSTAAAQRARASLREHVERNRSAGSRRGNR
jgi:hypothetical protein